MKPLVIYHADCTDGFAAAFAAWLKLGDEADYAPAHYGMPFLEDNWFDVKEREVYILDFSFPREQMDFIFAYAKRVVWLDHHKTAFEMWCRKYEKDTWFLDKPNGHYISLDDNKSGALLAWEYFHPGTEVPMLIQHIDDRDRWQFKLEGSKEIHAALGSYKPWSFQLWQRLFESFATAPGHFLTAGAAILRAQDAHVESMLKQARKCEILWNPTNLPGEDTPLNAFRTASGLAVNASLHQSEVGHELATQGGTYGLVWYLGNDKRARCSLRSNGDYDVSTIAKSFGGGGHRNAAGFELDIATLMDWLQ